MKISKKKHWTTKRDELSFINVAEMTYSSKALFRKALFIGVLAWITFFVLPLFQFTHVEAAGGESDPPDPLPSSALLEQGQENIGLPLRLTIPVINVDAAIEHVGFTPDGAMGVPSKLVEAAWFDLGPRPGQKGSAVIAGHRSSKLWVSAVFDHLRDLRVGDNLYIEDDQGTIISFKVREIRTYDPKEDASAVFSMSDGRHLNLITCSGDWDAVQKSFNQRLVIFADVVQ